MSEQIKDGGPAFPLKDPAMGDAQGMTLRDYFAAKAMASFAWRINPVENRVNESFEKCLAEAAYMLADAMLAASEVKS